MHIITSTTSRINIVFNISCFESLGEPIGEVAWTSRGRWSFCGSEQKENVVDFLLGVFEVEGGGARNKKKMRGISFGGVGRGGTWHRM